MTGFFEPPQHMGAEAPFFPCPYPRVFSKIQAGTINTNQCSLHDESSGKGTISHLEMLHTTSPYIDMSPCIVVIVCNGTAYPNTSSTPRSPLRLQPTTTPWDICISLTDKLFLQYVKSKTPLYQCSEGKSFDIHPLLPSSQSTIAR